MGALNKLVQHMQAGIYRYLVLFLFSSTFTLTASSQAQTWLHMDQPFYVGGEFMHYTLYLPTGVDKSIMVAVSLYDEQGALQHQSYIKRTAAKSIQGHYRIPFEAPSGLYRLRATVNKPFEKDEILLVEAMISVYSDELLDNPAINWSQNTTAGNFELASDLNVTMTIKSRQSDFHPRDTIDLIVAVKDSQGNAIKGTASISVRDQQLLIDDADYGKTLFKGTVDLNTLRSATNVIQKHGSLRDKLDQQLLTFTMVEGQKMYYATSDAQGEFYLELPDFYSNQALQYIAHYNDDQRISWKKARLNPLPKGSLKHTQDVKNYLVESRQRKLIYQLFNQIEGASQVEERPQTFMTPADQTIDASSYPFENLGDFCREVVTQLKYVKGKKRHWYFRIFNPETRDMMIGTPLFIVDGQMTKDFDFLSQIDFQKLLEIKLFYFNETISDQFGFVGFSGVVVLNSKEGKLKVPNAFQVQEFQVFGLQLPLSANISTAVDLHHPSLLPQLYWKSNLTIDKEEAVVSYAQSDDKSDFLVEVFFQGDDGRIGHQKLVYSVR